MLDFDPADDLAITDGTEAVTLLRRGSTPGGPGEIISHALRRAITAAEATINTSSDVHKNVPSDGQHTAASVVWHLPVAELPIAPQLGDVLLDGGGQRWTILEVKQATLGARWRCESKNVAVAFGLDDTISVLKAVGTAGDAGSGQTVWRTWRTGVRARIQPIQTTITNIAGTAATTASYRIFVEENLELDHTCCIRGPDGTLYTITRSVGAERIGELQVIEVQRTDPAAVAGQWIVDLGSPTGSSPPYGVWQGSDGSLCIVLSRPPTS
jgi:hypothetical protein